MNNILQALASLGRPGTFWAQQNIPASSLRISVKGFPGKSNQLRWPLSARAAKSLIKLARPASFGWKDQTLLDVKIRDVWEIPARQVKIDKRSWNAMLDRALAGLQARLGLPAESTLEAQLHNLLIYEPGQFFSPHQDSEKLDGMVATLVVVLPAHYRGGALVVDHQGEKKRFLAPRTAGDALSLVAFYADCHHEVKPVTEGYRVTLTFNLSMAGASGKAVLPAGQEKTAALLAQALRRYFRPEGAEDGRNDREAKPGSAPKKWVYLLDHQYTRKSLHWQRLKNADGLRAGILKELADTLGLEAHLALAEVRETWDCEEEGAWGYGYRRNAYWDRYDDEEDEEEAEAALEDDGLPANLVARELIDDEVALKHWIDGGGRPVKYGDMGVRHGELFWTRASKEFSPFESEYEGFMGNYGNTLDRWYHRAALVLWRQEDNDAVLCGIEPEKVIGELLRSARRESSLPQARERLRLMLPYWSAEARGRLPAAVFKLALHIRDAELARSLLAPLGLQALSAATAPALARLELGYGSPWGLQVLNTWMKPEKWQYAPSPGLIAPLLPIVEALLRESGSRSGLPAHLLNYQYNTLRTSGENLLGHANTAELAEREPDRIRSVCDLLAASVLAGEKALHSRILDYLIKNDRLYSNTGLADLLLLASNTLSHEDFQAWGHGAVLGKVRARLQQRISQGERDKDDWSIEPLSACACPDCGQLNRFLQSGREKTLVWPLRKDRRQHIHRQIDWAGLPVTHVTRRTGSPQQLVLTKTAALFQQDRRELLEARQTLALLERLQN